VNDKDQKLLWEAYESSVNEEWDEHDERDDAHSRAGLSPFSSTHEDEGWPAADTIDAHGEEVITSAVEFLDKELLHPKVTAFADIHHDLKNDVAGWVINDLQKSDKLGKYLDYEAHAEERMALKDAVEDFLTNHFDELIDAAEDKAVERGDKPPADYGADEFPQEGPEDGPITIRPHGHWRDPS